MAITITEAPSMRASNFRFQGGRATKSPACNDNARGTAADLAAGAGWPDQDGMEVLPTSLPFAAAGIACAPLLALGLGLSMAHLVQRLAMANAGFGFAMLGAMAAAPLASRPQQVRLRLV